MDIFLLFLQYALLAVFVVFSAKKIADTVDQLDKLTNIGGAMIGGVFLAAVTSLPELITSISAAIIGEPGLAFGNVYGSNLFNMMVLGLVDLIFIRLTFMNRIKAMRKSNLFVLLLYVVVLMPLLMFYVLGNSWNYFEINIFKISFSLISAIVIVIYVFSIRMLSKEKPSEERTTQIVDKNDPNVKKQVKVQIIRFLGWSVVLVASSILITIVTSRIDHALDIGSSLAGALFLGAATSLPEFTALIQLVRLRNYDAACGNIIGSNVFNFTIISAVDLVYNKENIFAQITNPGSGLLSNITLLLVLGIFSTLVLMYSIARTKSINKFTYAFPSILLIGSYVAYLVLSFL